MNFSNRQVSGQADPTLQQGLGVLAVPVIASFAWFFSLEGAIGERWRLVNEYLGKYSEPITIGVVGIIVGFAILAMLAVSIFGFGVLGNRIKSYRKKKGQSFFRFFPSLVGGVAFGITWYLLSRMGVFSDLEMVPYVIPKSHARLFIEFSTFGYSLFSGAILGGLTKLIEDSSFSLGLLSRIPPVPRDRNILVLGVINER